MPDNQTTTDVARIERMRRAFGDALSVRVNMKTCVGDIPAQVMREALEEALALADQELASKRDKLARAVCMAWGVDPDGNVFWDDDTFKGPAWMTRRAQNEAKAFLAMMEIARDF